MGVQPNNNHQHSHHASCPAASSHWTQEEEGEVNEGSTIGTHIQVGEPVHHPTGSEGATVRDSWKGPS